MFRHKKLKVLYDTEFDSFRFRRYNDQFDEHNVKIWIFVDVLPLSGNKKLIVQLFA